MECPKCRHKVLETSGKCLYCGARLGEAVPPTSDLESPGHVALPENSADQLTGVRVKVKEYECEKLEDLPPSVRKRAEAMLKKGGGRTQMMDFKSISPGKDSRYNKLEDLPESLRQKVEDILRNGSEDPHGVSIKMPRDFSEQTPGKKKKMNFFSALKLLLKGAFI